MPHRSLPKYRNLRIATRAGAAVGPPPATLPPPAAPLAPEWLDADASAEWARLVPLMIQRGTWAIEYSSHVAIYCSLIAKFKRDPEGFGATRLSQLRLYAGDLGLDPAHAHVVERRR